jgi:hypothetical protein
MKRIIPDKKVLEDLLDSLGSVSKVSVELRVSYNTVRAWFKKYSIEYNNPGNTTYHQLRKVSFSDYQKSIVLGSVLGDGCVKKNKSSRTARLQIGHCTKQLGYLKWKKEQLQPFVRVISEAEKPGVKYICGKKSYSSGYYIMNTIAHPDLNAYYNKYYFKGGKRVNEEIIDSLDLVALSVWLGDDGSFSLRKDPGCINSLKGSIATCSFSFEENEILVEALKKFFKGNICLSTGGNSKGKKYPVIYLSGTPAINDLLDRVTSILPECIHYKFASQRLHARPLR